jgi:hypothetical protein
MLDGQGHLEDHLSDDIMVATRHLTGVAITTGDTPLHIDAGDLMIETTSRERGKMIKRLKMKRWLMM